MSEKDRGEEIQGELDGLMSGDSAPGVPPQRAAGPGAGDAPPPARAAGAADPRSEGGPEGAAPPDVSRDPAEPDVPEDRVEPDVPETSEEESERLSRALEMLEERVSLLLERHSDLLRRHGEAIEELSSATERLDRLRGDGKDPEELDRTIRELEGENERLSRHATFLERRIEGLLNRVRYVVES